MAKRFTDIAKWTNNKWFFNLCPESKLFWEYLRDMCDSVGVWEENIDLASKIIGYVYSLDTLLEDFKNQIHIFDNGKKWWIKKFCEFQYGELEEKSLSKPNQSYISKLKKHSLWILYTKGIETLKEKEKDKEKDKVKDKVKIKVKEKELTYPFDSELFFINWQLWKDYKKQQFRFIYKEIGEQGALKDIDELSGHNEEMAIKIIYQSIKKGWKGFFELKENITQTDMDEFKKQILKDMQDGQDS